MRYIGIDIGSTASKTVVLEDGKEDICFTLPTGWSGKETAMAICKKLDADKGGTGLSLRDMDGSAWIMPIKL